MAVIAGRTLSMVDAIGEAMRQAMEADPAVIVMGEDVAGGAGRGGDKENAMGGSFGATKSLYPLFGASRVRDTPISEAGFVGAGVGAAAQHSGTLYSVYTHLPGIKVVVPSTPYDAKGLLLEAIFDDSPVIFFEHLKLYVTQGEVPEEPYRVPLGVADVRREGTDVTVVAIAAMVGRALEAADVLAGEGISAEVIDPRTLSPLDERTIIASVGKTGALVVVDESPPRCSVASEIAATVSEQAFDLLNGPVRRVTAPHAPVPFAPSLEAAYAPSVDAIVAAVKTLA